MAAPGQPTVLPVAADGRSAFQVAEQAVRAAAEPIVTNLPQMALPADQRIVQVFHKDGWNNLVTDVDRAAEDALLAVITNAFPTDAIVAEESGSRAGTSGYSWIVDPLDGTRNFASANPHVCVNLALTHGDRLVLGLTYDPFREELFHAIEGGGAFLNGERISVSEQDDLRECVLGTDMGYLGDEGKLMLNMLSELWPGVQSVRMAGSAALGVAYAAAGRFELYVHHYVQPWDIAPGLLLVREAGGMATDLRGAYGMPASGCIIAAAPGVHAAFMRATDGMPWRASQQAPH
jgi:myo-inositol-1(or 4)-monophosphatase